MKKISAFLLAVVLVLCCVAGCGKQSNTSDEKTIKVLYEGWVNGAVPLDYESNPYKKLIDEVKQSFYNDNAMMNRIEMMLFY